MKCNATVDRDPGQSGCWCPARSITCRSRTALLLLAHCLLLVGSALAQTTASEQGVVSGCIELAGHRDYRGVASLWPADGSAPDPRRAIRPPLLSGPLSADGCFTLQADAGEYFLGGVLRLTSGGWQGPPRPGDMVFFSPDAAGGNLRVSVSSGMSTQIGRQAGGWTYAGFDNDSSAPIVTGRLTDSDGEPVAGLLVFAFLDSTMTREPVAISAPSGRDGDYVLRFSKPATVYLRVREHYGQRSPLDGGYMGVYGGASPLPVTVGEEEKGLPRNLQVFLIPALADRSNRLQAPAALDEFD